ncbi:MAG TPA: IS110 family transposase [Chloroflexota bacterium]|nr:IS110 family transposase [Chloroflexota bacterium]
MEVVYERCCGVDVHKRFITACLIVPGPSGKPTKEVQTFRTMTGDLERFRDWLLAAGCTHVAMESTGVYWKPIYNLLEEHLTVIVANAQHIKQVPGRKTDVRDCEWIADLLRHGLLQGSFIPDRTQRELRELTRYRSSLIQERAAEVNRLQKVLEGATIKLAAVTRDMTGVSCREMLAELVAGSRDADAMANLARGKLRAKIPELREALIGRMQPHQQFLIAEQLAHIDTLDEAIERVSKEIEQRTRPFAEVIALLDTIPGVAQRTAEVLVAEIGTEMSRFPTAAHLASWAGLAPGNNESGGKRRSGKTRKGSPWLRTALVEAANGAGRKNGTYLQAQYRQLSRRKGKKRAAVAVAHSIIVIAYHVIKERRPYNDLGADYLDRRRSEAAEQRLVNQLRARGYTVTPQEAA